MSHTNSTTNYGLSQFIGTDKPAWLVDYNGDMIAIDTAIKSASNDASAANTLAGTADGKADANALNISTLDGQINDPATGLAPTVGILNTAVTSLGNDVSAIQTAIANKYAYVTDDVFEFNWSSEATFSDFMKAATNANNTHLNTTYGDDFAVILSGASFGGGNMQNSESLVYAPIANHSWSVMSISRDGGTIYFLTLHVAIGYDIAEFSMFTINASTGVITVAQDIDSNTAMSGLAAQFKKVIIRNRIFKKL